MRSARAERPAVPHGTSLPPQVASRSPGTMWSLRGSGSPRLAARDRGRDDGAVLVEFAIIVPLLLLMVLGTIELAQFMRANTSVTTLAREGARTASAESRLDGFTTDAAAAVARSATSLPLDRVRVWVYLVTPAGAIPPSVNSDGTPPASCGTATCVEYSGWVDPAGTTPGSFTLRNGVPIASSVESWSAATINACLRDAKAHSVGVYVQARHDWLFDLIFPAASTTIRSRTVMKFEPVVPRPDAIPASLRKCKP